MPRKQWRGLWEVFWDGCNEVMVRRYTRKYVVIGDEHYRLVDYRAEIRWYQMPSSVLSEQAAVEKDADSWPLFGTWKQS